MQAFPVMLFPTAQATEQKQYLVSKLSLADYENVNNHVRAKIIRAARLSLEGCENPHIRKEVLDSAMRAAGEISLLSGEHAAYFGGIDGNAVMLFYALGKHLKDFTMEQAAEIVRDNRNVDEANTAYWYMRGLTPQDLADMKRKQEEKERQAKADSENPIQSGVEPQSNQTEESARYQLD
jgi:hypothetical protein